MASQDYIAVAADDWYQRRRNDAEGEFFRSVANQGPRKGQGGSTRQGIYCLTADGKLLAYKNAGQAPEVMRDTLKQGLRAWLQLPEERRKPGAVRILSTDHQDTQYSRQPPKDGLILKVYTRILDRNGDQLARGTCETPGGEKAARDHLWLTAAEVQSLIPRNPTVGDSFALPTKMAERLARFHLIDNTRGEPPMWSREDLRSHKITLTVRTVTDERVELMVQGTVLLASKPDSARAERGFDVTLAGMIDCQRSKRRIERLEMVAIGEHWGEGTYTRNARPGRQPLGVAFELGDPKQPQDRIAPQAARELNVYFGKE